MLVLEDANPNEPKCLAGSRLGLIIWAEVETGREGDRHLHAPHSCSLGKLVVKIEVVVFADLQSFKFFYILDIRICFSYFYNQCK